MYKFMVRLKNIKKNGNIASCDYCPEDWETCGKIEVNLTTKDIISDIRPLKECSDMYPFYAKRRLIDICISTDIPPNESLCMWY